jgi:hypothetical protein
MHGGWDLDIYTYCRSCLYIESKIQIIDILFATAIVLEVVVAPRKSRDRDKRAGSSSIMMPLASAGLFGQSSALHTPRRNSFFAENELSLPWYPCCTHRRFILSIPSSTEGRRGFAEGKSRETYSGTAK